MNLKTLLVICLLAQLICLPFQLSGCTAKERARRYGGTSVEKLPPNRKLINATWKENSLWILTRQMIASDNAEKYEFKESSSYGMYEGTVIIEEVKQ